MAGVAGIHVLSGQGITPAIFRGARALLDSEGASWVEDHAGAAMGHCAPPGGGGHSRVFQSEDDRLWLALDGEVFEIDDRRAGGEEGVLPRLLDEYLRHGPDFVSRLNGVFTVAVLDRRQGAPKTILACDRCGALPVFYALSGGVFIYSSRLSRLVGSGLIRIQPDPEAAADFFALSYVLGDDTLFAGVKSLSPGSILVHQDGKLSMRSYAALEPRPPQGRSALRRSLHEIAERFLEAVDLQTAGEQKLGLGLTGGFDSRAVAGAAARLGRDLVTVTHSLPNATDTVLAARIAGVCGFEHLWVPIEAESLPDHVPRLIDVTGGLIANLEPHPLACLAKFSEAGQIFLTGVGGEFGRGFYYPRRQNGEESLAERDVADYLFRRINHPFQDSTELDRVFVPGSYHGLRERSLSRLRRIVEAMPEGSSASERLDRFYLFQRVRKLLIVKGTLVVRGAVEVRHPFLDRRLLDLIWRAPAELKRGNAIHKHLIRSCMPELTAIPLTKTGRSAHAGIQRRLVTTFAGKARTALFLLARRKPPRYVPRQNYDYAGWMRGSLGDQMMSILMDERTLDRGLFDRRETLKVLDDHFSGRRDRAAQMMALAAFELSLRVADGGNARAETAPAAAWAKPAGVHGSL